MSYSMERMARPSGDVPGAIMTWTIGGQQFLRDQVFRDGEEAQLREYSPMRPWPSCHTMSGAGTAGSTPGEA